MDTIQHLSGVTAELFVAATFSGLGYNVLWPQSAQSRYDLVLEKGGDFTRLQIKKGTWSVNGRHKYLQARISTRNKSSKPLYVAGEFDFFAFTDLKKVWLAPFKELEDYTSVCLGSTNPKYKPQTKYDANEWLLTDENNA